MVSVTVALRAVPPYHQTLPPRPTLRLWDSSFGAASTGSAPWTRTACAAQGFGESILDGSDCCLLWGEEIIYYAHSTSSSGKGDWQGLAEHLLAVAALAESFGRRLGIGRAAMLAGLLHDLGKYNPDFQSYIAGRGSSVDHSTAGASIVRGCVSGDDRIIGDLIAYAIAGHHAGLPDMNGEAFSTLAERLKGFSEASIHPSWKSEIAIDTAGLLPAFRWERTDRPVPPFSSPCLVG